MKRILLFILVSTSLFSGSAFGMKRKNDGEFEGREKKRRRVDPYASLKRDGKYWCPHCGQDKPTQYRIQEHLLEHERGLAKEQPAKKKKKRKKKKAPKRLKVRKKRMENPDDEYVLPSDEELDEDDFLFEKSSLPRGEKYSRTPKGDIYALYKRDGYFYCPDCLYTGKALIAFQDHIHSAGHAGNVRKSKYSRYEGRDGLYHCPKSFCDKCIESSNDFGKHLRGHRIDTSRLLFAGEPQEKWCDPYEDDGKFVCNDSDCDGFSCTKRFRFYYHLMTEEHSGWRAYHGACDEYKKDGWYVCPQCKKRFATAYEFRIHCQTLKDRRSINRGAAGCNGVVLLSGEAILQARRGQE